MGAVYPPLPLSPSSLSFSHFSLPVSFTLSPFHARAYTRTHTHTHTTGGDCEASSGTNGQCDQKSLELNAEETGRLRAYWCATDADTHTHRQTRTQTQTQTQTGKSCWHSVRQLDRGEQEGHGVSDRVRLVRTPRQACAHAQGNAQESARFACACACGIDAPVRVRMTKPVRRVCVHTGAGAGTQRHSRCACSKSTSFTCLTYLVHVS